jgi:hypothetical protein
MPRKVRFADKIPSEVRQEADAFRKDLFLTKREHLPPDEGLGERSDHVSEMQPATGKHAEYLAGARLAEQRAYDAVMCARKTQEDIRNMKSQRKFSSQSNNSVSAESGTGSSEIEHSDNIPGSAQGKNFVVMSISWLSDLLRINRFQ